MRRLFDDPQLPAALRHDLQRSRAAAQDYPVSEKWLQLRAALLDNSRQPLDDSAHSQLSDVGRASPWRASQLWGAGWKLLLIVALAGTGAVAVQRWQSESGDAHAHSVQEQIALTPPVGDALDPTAAEPQVAQPSAAVDVALAGQASAPAAVERPRVSRTAAALKASSTDSSSRREIAQLVHIRELVKKDPAAAYELAQRSEREFPSGLLSAERQALAIVALAKTGAADEARRKANAFFLRYPQSPMRERIEAALAR